MQQDEPDQAPQRLVQKRGMHGQRGVEPVAAQPLLDGIARHAPRQRRVGAEGLLIEEVAPAAARLPDQKTERRDIEHREGVELAYPTHDQPGGERHDQAAVDAKAALPDVQDRFRVGKIGVALIAEQHIVQPRADEGQQRAHQDGIDHLVGIEAEGSCMGQAVDHRQQKADGDAHTVPFDRERVAEQREAEQLIAQRQVPPEGGKLDVFRQGRQQIHRKNFLSVFVGGYRRSRRCAAGSVRSVISRGGRSTGCVPRSAGGGAAAA